MRLTLTASFLCTGLLAQSVAIYPADYANVAEGPFNSPNLPLADGTSRVLVVYESWDLPIPDGAAITRLGFRQDATLTAIDAAQTLQLEVRMGYTANTATSLSTTFDNNYSGTPTTVFGPGLFALPPLRDAANPLPNGQLWIDLAAPFAYDSNNGNLLVEYRIFGNTASGAAFTYRLDRADFYSPRIDGPAGCPHGGGTPQLTLQPCRAGSSFSSQLTTAPANALAILFLDAGAQLVPPYPLTLAVPGIGASCQGQVALANPLSLVGFTGTTGSLTQSLSIPNDVALFNDLFLACQAAIFDFFVPGGVVVSNGSQVQIGARPQSSMLVRTGPPATATTGTITQLYCPVALFTWQ